MAGGARVCVRNAYRIVRGGGRGAIREFQFHESTDLRGRVKRGCKLSCAYRIREPRGDADDGFRKKGLNPSYEAANTGAAPSHGAPSIASAMLSTRKPPAGMAARSGVRVEAMACSG